MVELLAPRTAFADRLHGSPAPHGGEPGIIVAERTGLQLASVIARVPRPILSERVRAAFGLDLADGPSRTRTARLAALGIGPRSWLLVEDGGSPGFTTRLTAALGPAAAIADQSDGYAVLRVSGRAARAALAKGISVDLHARAFGTERVAVSTCSHIGIIIWQVDEAPTFEIAMFRSYAASFADWLAESTAEFGLRIDPPN
jgi:heterotetrameric sarcosine oxidase gamma subunit